MIAPQNGDPIPVAHFQGDKQADGLDRVIASVNIVPHEEVVCVRAVPSYSEQLQEVLKLPMDVATDSHWALHMLHILFPLQRSNLQLMGASLVITYSKQRNHGCAGFSDANDM